MIICSDTFMINIRKAILMKNYDFQNFCLKNYDFQNYILKNYELI